MQQDKKNKIIFILGLLTLIFFICLISSSQDKAKQKALYQQEIRRRMEMEERILTLSKRNANLEDKTIRLQELLKKERANCEATQEGLNQEILELEAKLETISRTYFRRSK